MDNLVKLAELIKARNKVAGDITDLIGRPAQLGHIGEYIAARVFGIELEASASHKGIDGHFVEGPLVERTVNVKWYAKGDGLLNVTPEDLPDFYLVLTGPRQSPGSSRGAVRPWLIEAVYLFASRELKTALDARGVKVGVATSVRRRLWDEAEIYPTQRNGLLLLSDEQREMLSLFGGD